MKRAVLRALLLLATVALTTSGCCSDDDVVTKAMSASAGMHSSDLIFYSDCRQPQMFAPPDKYVPASK